MKITANQTFVVYHDEQMHVFNVGTSGDLPDDVAAQYVESGLATEITDAACAEPQAEPAAPAEPAPQAPASGKASKSK